MCPGGPGVPGHMGAAFPLFLILAAVVVVGAILVGGLMRSWSARQHEVNEQISGPGETTLEYRVPTGQDPAAVLTALSQDGYVATTDPGDTQVVHVACPAGADRARAGVRSVIGSVHTTGIDSGAPFDAGRVRFRDEL